MKINNLLVLPPVILSLLGILLSGSKCKRQEKDWCGDVETHKILCKHFCLLKQDGKSTFRYTHVHIAGKKGKLDPAQTVTGIGHDDETPGMANPTDAHHQTRSKGDGTVVFDPPKAAGESADQVGKLGYQELAQVSYHPKSINREGKCPDGWTEVKCDDCNDVICITCDHARWESWHDIYKFKYLDPGEIEPYADENKDARYCLYVIMPPLPAQSELKERELICVRCKDNAEKCEFDYRTLKLNDRIYTVYPISDGGQCRECSNQKTFQLKEGG